MEVVDEPWPPPMSWRVDAPEELVERPRGVLATVRKYLAITVVASIFGGLGQTCLFLQPRGCGGGVDPIISALNACPQAVAALGGDIQQSFVGWSCVNNSESQGDCDSESWHGHAAGTLAVHGTKARGSVKYAQKLEGCGNWTMMVARLTVDGEEIAVVPCL